MTSTRYILGISFEGVGSDASTSGDCFYYGLHGAPSDPSGYVWKPGLTRLPSQISTSIDPITGDLQTSSFTFSLSQGCDLATSLLAPQTRSSVVLGSDASSLDTSLDLPSSLAGETVYLSGETIELGTVILGGLITGCVRGLYGSENSAHGAGTKVYGRVPWWASRAVRVVRHDLDTGSNTILWRGYVDNIETSTDGTTIEVRCSEFLQRWRRASVNREPRNLNAGRGLRTNGRRVYGTIRDRDGSSLPGVLAPSLLTSDRWIPVQLAGAVVPAFWDSSSEQLTVNASVRSLRLGSELELPEREGPGEDAPFTDPVYELCVWDRIGDSRSAVNVSVPPTSPRFHPIRVAQALLMSSGVGGLINPLSEAWGLGIGSDVLDLTTFEDLITSTPELEIDQLLLGWDGEPVEVFQVVTEMLRSFGFFWALTEDGQLSLTRVAIPDIDDFEQAQNNSVSPHRGMLKWQSPSGAGVTEIKALVGKLPFSEGVSVLVHAEGTSKRASILSDAERVSYDLQTLRASSAEDAALRLADSTAVVSFGFPKLTIKVGSSEVTGASYDIGSYVTLSVDDLETAWFIDRDGNRVPSSDIGSRVDFVGKIYSRRLNLSDMSVELGLLLTAYRTGDYVRLRAPSGVVVGVTGSGTQIELEEDTFKRTTRDADTFQAGDQVTLWSRNGTLIDGDVKVIVSIATDTIQITSSWTTAPSPGNVIRLSTYDDYDNTSRYSFTTNCFTWLGDSEGLVGTGSDGPFIYGGSLGA